MSFISDLLKDLGSNKVRVTAKDINTKIDEFKIARQNAYGALVTFRKEEAFESEFIKATGKCIRGTYTI